MTKKASTPGIYDANSKCVIDENDVMRIAHVTRGSPVVAIVLNDVAQKIETHEMPGDRKQILKYIKYEYG
jgi:hypothetical protein